MKINYLENRKPLTWHENGDPNSSTLNPPEGVDANWVCVIQFNGELLPSVQRALAAAFAASVGNISGKSIPERPTIPNQMKPIYRTGDLT